MRDARPVAMTGARRIGILIDEFADLAGAADFLTSVVDALCRTAEGREVVFILRQPPARWSARGMVAMAVKLAKDVVRRRRPSLPPRPVDPQASFEQMAARVGRRPPFHVVSATPEDLARLCEREGIDVVMPPHIALKGYRLPWVGYIFDFQHRYYPHFFTPRVLRYRDRQFDDTLSLASTVIVNARQVKVDAERFHRPGARIIPLPFSAAADPRWFGADPAEARRRYGIGERYFMISNQFWVHKRHEVAIAAFLRVASLHPDLELVCTGSTEDWRAPDHFARLQAMIAESGLGARIHILGLIPKLDQIALLRDCVAVVQPTAFEGGPGGGSVFDAVALGVRSIVSDLPVNREIEEHVTAYFPLDDIDALAAAMERVAGLPAAHRLPDEVLARQGEERRVAMGRALWSAADDAVAAHAGNPSR